MNKPVPFGKYYLLERINIGGMAEVFRAKAYGVEGFERLVAVKRILPNIAEDKEFIEMFVDEAKIAVQLNHANVAQIFDLGRAEGAYYIALEHVHGRDLRALYDRCAERRERMPIAQAVYIIMKVCEGLDYAHNKRDQAGRPLNLVHRDVSPQNVLVSFEGEVKIVDFGIAKAAGKDAQTRSGILKGKFGYMSPEQVRGLPIDRRSDIFSCGIVLYELLTGERLFLGASDFSTLEKVRNVEILPPSTYHPGIPEELERIVLKALAREVDERYQNAIDLHDDLQSFVYAAGAFGSRKDLAGWMKGMFAREIEEETAKLERYRQVRPPPPPPPGVRRSGSMATLRPPSAGGMGYDPVPGSSFHGDGDDGETRVYSQEPGAPGTERAGAGHTGAARAASESGTLLETQTDTTALGPRPEWPEVAPDATVVTPAPVEASGHAEAADPRAVIAPGGPVPSRPGRRRGKGLSMGAAAAAVLLLGGGLAGYALFREAGGRSETGAGHHGPAGAGQDPSAAVRASTGIDLFVEPREVTVELAGKVLRMSSPMRIRDLAPGEHELIITGPPGFHGKTERVLVTAGKAELVQVSLEPLNITGRFASEPPGASVSLVINGDQAHAIALGPAPAVHALDPRKRYEVIFEKQGYERATLPVAITGRLEEQVTAVLVPRSDGVVASVGGARGAHAIEARSAPVAPRAQGEGKGEAEAEASPRSRRARGDGAAGASSRSPAGDVPAPGAREGASGGGGAPDPAGAPATGTLMLGSKPPCRILVDGKDTGKTTPQRDLALPVGTHRITLVNREHGITESFEVRIEAGKTTRVIKDMSDRLE